MSDSPGKGKCRKRGEPYEKRLEVLQPRLLAGGIECSVDAGGGSVPECDPGKSRRQRAFSAGSLFKRRLSGMAAAVAAGYRASGHGFGLFYSKSQLYADKAAAPQTAAGSSYKRGDLSDLCGRGAFYDRQSGGLDQYPVPLAGPDGNRRDYSGLVYTGFSVFMDFVRRYDPVDPLQRLGGFGKENHSAAENVSVPYAGLADRAGRDPGCAAGAGGGYIHLGFCIEPGFRQRSAAYLDGR